MICTRKTPVLSGDRSLCSESLVRKLHDSVRKCHVFVRQQHDFWQRHVCAVWNVMFLLACLVKGLCLKGFSLLIFGSEGLRCTLKGSECPKATEPGMLCVRKPKRTSKGLKCACLSAAILLVCVSWFSLREGTEHVGTANGGGARFPQLSSGECRAGGCVFECTSRACTSRGGASRDCGCRGFSCPLQCFLEASESSCSTFAYGGCIRDRRDRRGGSMGKMEGKQGQAFAAISRAAADSEVEKHAEGAALQVFYASDTTTERRSYCMWIPCAGHSRERPGTCSSTYVYRRWARLFFPPGDHLCVIDRCFDDRRVPPRGWAEAPWADPTSRPKCGAVPGNGLVQEASRSRSRSSGWNALHQRGGCCGCPSFRKPRIMEASFR